MKCISIYLCLKIASFLFHIFIIDLPTLLYLLYPGEQEVSGMSVASIRKSTRRLLGSANGRSQSDQLLKYSPEDSNEQTTSKSHQLQPHLSQKQVLLVLKNITLKDGFEDYNRNNHSSPRTLNSLTNGNNVTTSNGFKQLETLINKASVTKTANGKLESIADSTGKPPTHGGGGGGYFPLAELLPAVDSSMRNSMPARYVRSLDGLGVVPRTDTDLMGKGSIVVAEDKIFNVNDDASRNTVSL